MCRPRWFVPIALCLGLAACSGGFTDGDIKAVKESIRVEFEKTPGNSVVEVVMLKESTAKLTGFVKLHSKALGDFTRSCYATMAESGREYLWRCGN